MNIEYSNYLTYRQPYLRKHFIKDLSSSVLDSVIIDY
jgi:hypothetical protein